MIDRDTGPHDMGDLKLQPAEAPRPAAPRPRRASSTGALVILGVLISVIVIFFYWRPLPFPRTGPDQPRAGRADSSTVPAEFGPIPPLDESDAFVRALVRQLSSRDELVAWLATDHLIRSFTVIVDKIAIGSSPAREMRAAAPNQPFQTIGSGEALRIDPRSYSRYDTFAAVVDSVDTEGAARAYRRLRPLLQQAFNELGYTNLTFDARMALALGRLVDTPVQEGDVMLRQTSVTFQFADPDLEALSPAQKHLIRMGPRNMQLVQNKLRAFARAAGLTQSS